MKTLLVLYWLCLLGYNVEANSVCSIRTTLPFLTQRKVGYVLKPGEPAVSDYYLREKWYSLPNYTLALNSFDSCGVARHWFLQDNKMPEEGKTIDATICIEDGYTCKGFPGKTIQIMYCGPDDYLFFLPPTDASDEGYCIVPIDDAPIAYPAPDISGIRPVIDTYVTTDTNDPRKRRLEFMCTFVSSAPYYWYTIEWVLADTSGQYRLLHTWAGDQLDMSAFNEGSKLTEYHLIAHDITKLGFEIACTVRAQQKNSIHSSTSNIQYSDRKFCGIQVVSKNPVVVTNTGEAVISIQLTVPFGCKNPNCFLDVSTYLPAQHGCEIPQLVVSQSSLLTSLDLQSSLYLCGARIANSGYNIVTNITMKNLLGDHGVSQAFDVILVARLSAHDFFDNYILPPIKVHSIVNVNQLSGTYCYAHSDPHTKPFDSSYTFESIGSGTFVMYRNKRFKTEVHIKQGICWTYIPQRDWPYCVVAVAVRAGADVYMIDLVNTKTAFVQCKDGVLSRKVRRKSNKEYVIYLPTGAEVHVSNTWFSFLEIDIFPGLHDFGETDGLCGKYDGTSQVNDFCDTCDKFKVDESASLFNKDAKIDSWSEDLTLCNCPNTGTAMDRTIDCKKELKYTCKLERYSEVGIGECYTSRRKRDMHVNYEFSPDIQAVTTARKDVSVRYRRSESIIDFDTARQLCLEEMNTTTVQLCSTVPGLSFASYYNDCASDYLASNSMEWVQIHIEGIKQTCIQYLEFHKPISPEIIRNVNLIDEYETNSTSVSTTAAPILDPDSVTELLQRIEDMSCVDDCNHNGDCVYGTCKCRTGYLGEDCAMHENEPPDIIGIPDNGLCDLSERPCEQTAVVGKHFVEGNLQCRLVPFKVFSDNTIVKETAISARARLDTFLQVFCTLPGAKRKRRSMTDVEIDVMAKGYAVSVSNTGQTFSVEDSILIFDSTCLECTKSGNVFCKKKPDFCVHEGNCYIRDDTVGCYRCLEQESGSLEWTSEGCTIEIGSDSPKLWIIGAVLGPLMIVVCVLVGLKCKWMHASKPETGEHVFTAAATPVVIRDQSLDQIKLYDVAI